MNKERLNGLSNTPLEFCYSIDIISLKKTRKKMLNKKARVSFCRRLLKVFYFIKKYDIKVPMVLEYLIF